MAQRNEKLMRECRKCKAKLLTTAKEIKVHAVKCDGKSV